MLSTALIKARTIKNTYEYLRAMIDTGSQATFITEHATQMLGGPKTKVETQVTGMGKSNAGISRSRIELELIPRYPSNFRLHCEALVLPSLTNMQPDTHIEVNNNILKNFLLADPTHNVPGPIDIVLGADVFADIILEGLEKIEEGLVAQRTQFGWILTGRTENRIEQKYKVTSMITRTDIDEQLKRFWEMEETSVERNITSEENQCEQYYEETTKRNRDGTYTVKIPFKLTEQALGESKAKALARFFQLERRFAKDSALKENYSKFIKEYIELGHMKQILPEENKNVDPNRIYYMPHQAVVREDSTTTKLRVVFDASTKTKNGYSLNDVMLNGPRLQQELQWILLRWRSYRYVYTADIEKMYRQIRVAREDQDFQRILWRFSPTQKVNEYKLTTVTYGTKSAPYLAIKTLHTLARDESETYPQASEVVRKDFYVDDLMSGSHSMEQAKKVQKELIELLKKGGFNLRKWKANNNELLEHLSTDLKDEKVMDVTKDETIKTLGVYWSPKSDNFYFKIQLCTSQNKVTKRTILAEVAKIYDPLGWLSPVIVRAKMLLQELWIRKYTWDEQIEEELANKWLKFRDQLHLVEKIIISRWIQYKPEACRVELHGFSDASEKAYGAVVYSKIIAQDGKAHITLLTSKSRVAPIKKLSLPKLELCAAVLLAKLIKHVKISLEWQNAQVHTWTDSTIVISWINGSPEKQAMFVSNRIQQIKDVTRPSDWHHIRSEENPADLVSRGVDPSTLKEKSLWWKGPTWLETSEKIRPCEITNVNSLYTDNDAEVSSHTSVITSAEQFEVLKKYSSLQKLVSIIAYCLRFITRCKKLQSYSKLELTTAEYQEALRTIIKLTQNEAFQREIHSLKANKSLNSKCKILSLNPFLDHHEILRVGGRLKNANIPFEQKHPIILPSKHQVTTLIIDEAHKTILHGGTEATLAYIRRKYWIINGRNRIKQQINRCVKCYRFKKQHITQIMGDLPAARIRPSKPFTHTGIDYAGPIQIKTAKGRGMRSYKGYIAIFICLCTKAIHIEVVSDMTSETFLAAFRRFTSRRGLPSHIFSDNGTTLIGAKRILDKELKVALKEISSIIPTLSRKGIQWHFIPPAAPHFGGLWEAGVKSIKFHMKRIIGETLLTFEELYTFLSQVEACLNSRPLYPITDDPDDIEVLTPAHFLIGQSLLTPIEPSREEIIAPLTNKWKQIQKMTNDFWKKWQAEYLSRLQQRPKWKKGNTELKIGDLVLVKNENYPPTRWPLAKIIQLHPGDDNVTRVVTLKCKENATIKRPVSKICLLPVENDDSTTELGKDRNHSSASSSLTTIIANRSESFTQKPSSAREKKPVSHYSTRSPMTWLLHALVLLGCVTNIHGQYNIKRPEPGFYVEHAGDIKIKRGVLRIDINVAFNISKEYERVKNIVNHMESVCKQSRKFHADTHCNSLLEHLREKQIKIGDELEILQNFNEQRRKRGLVGRLLQSVFGVNDEVYTNIESLEKNQELMKNSIQHQNVMMLATTTTVNELQGQLTQKINIVTDKLNSVIKEVNKVEGWYVTIDANKVGIQILAAYQISVDILSDLYNHYVKLTTAETRNVLEFISPSELQKIIEHTRSKLPSSLATTQRPENRVEIQLEGSNMIISGFLDITEANTYDLSKVTAIPSKIANQRYIVPEISSSFIAVDYNNQKYFEISEDEMKSCSMIQKHIMLCQPRVVNQIETNGNCMIDTLYHRQLKRKCPVHEFEVSTIVWKHLYLPNTWLFVANTATEVAIICNGQREDILLENIGIIKINQECLIKTQHHVLFSEIKNQVSIKSTFLKPIDHSQLNVSAGVSSFKPNILQPILSTTNSWSKLKGEDRSNIVNSRWRQISHHSGLISIPLILILFTVIITMRFCKQCNWRVMTKAKEEDSTPDFILTSPDEGSSSSSSKEPPHK